MNLFLGMRPHPPGHTHQRDANIPFIELGRDLHIENVLPHGYKSHKDWTDAVPNEVAEKWINRAGNLTLLSGAKNIGASNNPFAAKIRVYQGKGLHDDRDAKITAFSITPRIVNDFNQGMFQRRWNQQAIVSRWNWFCAEVEKVLSITLSAIKEKPVEEDPVHAN